MVSESEPGGGVHAVITVGVDGRLYCQDLPSELLLVVVELCPNDPELLIRKSLALVNPEADE